MVEIIVVIFLCRANKKNAEINGRKPGSFIGITLLLWFGLEFIGAMIGAIAGLGMGTYVIALLFAVCGGVISYFIAKNARQGDYLPPSRIKTSGKNAPTLQNQKAVSTLEDLKNVNPIAYKRNIVAIAAGFKDFASMIVANPAFERNTAFATSEDDLNKVAIAYGFSTFDDMFNASILMVESNSKEGFISLQGK